MDGSELDDVKLRYIENTCILVKSRYVTDIKGNISLQAGGLC